MPFIVRKKILIMAFVLNVVINYIILIQIVKEVEAIVVINAHILLGLVGNVLIKIINYEDTLYRVFYRTSLLNI